MLLNLGSPNHTLVQCMTWVVLMPLSLFPVGRKKAGKSAENFDHSRLALPGTIYLVVKCGTKLNGDLPLQSGKFLSSLIRLFSYFDGYYFTQNFFLTCKS